LKDYAGIQEALRALLEATTYSVDVLNVISEAMERDIDYSKMPLINVRLTSTAVELKSISDTYHNIIVMDVDIICFDLSLFKNAATLRDTILKEAIDAVRSNKDFHVDLETSFIGPEISFQAGAPEGNNGHVASATFSVMAECHVDAL